MNVVRKLLPAVMLGLVLWMMVPALLWTFGVLP